MARTFQDNFTPEQLSLIYGLLLDLTKHVPWKGIDADEFWSRVCGEGSEAAPIAKNADDLRPLNPAPKLQR
jgi:hypothetical protein